MTLILPALAWLSGIVLASKVQIPIPITLAGFTLALLLAFLLKEKRLLLLSALFLGMIRLYVARPSFGPNHLAYYNDHPEPVAIRGLVSDAPLEKEKALQLRISAISITLGGEEIPVKGDFIALVPLLSDYRYGDLVEASGKLETPPVWQDFSYRDYLARKGVFSILKKPQVRVLERGRGNPLKHFLLSLRKKAHEVLLLVYPEPEASLLAGILLGLDKGIPSDVMESFRRTGTSHIIAISGFNIAILAGFLGRFLSRFGKRRTWPIIVVALFLYAFLVGADPPVLRAAVMGSLYVLAEAVGREAFSLNSLAFAAIVLTALNPETLWDVGFQLSFAATLSLILFVPPVEEWIRKRFPLPHAWENLVKEALIVTLVVQLATLPLTLYYFGLLSLAGPLANFLIIPAQPGVMIGGGMGLLVGFLSIPLGKIAGVIGWAHTAYTIRVVEFLASFHWAAIPLKGWGKEISLACSVGLVILLILAKAGRRLGEILAKQWRFGATFTLLSSLAILVWSGALLSPDGNLHVVFCDVGEGDGIFILTPAGHKILIDGGPLPSRFLECVGKRLPFWERTVDLIILTHPDTDHLTGLVPVVERYEVKAVLESGLKGDSEAWKRWEELLEARKIPRYEARKGTIIRLSDGVLIQIVHPESIASCPNDNACSVVARLTYGKASFLFTGDIDSDVEAELVREGVELSSAVLKVSHHGAGNATSQAFLEAVKPMIAVISVGKDNPFNHPAKAVLDRLRGVKVLRTDLCGTVEIVSDGRVLWTR